MTYRYDPNQDPADVLREAADLDGPWGIWEPGDVTRYRVRVIPMGSHTDERVLLVATMRTLCALRFIPPTSYDFEQWNESRWKNDLTLAHVNGVRGYDWWPVVIRPLLQAAGAA